MNINLTAEIRFRCPSCQKLFCTEKSVFDLHQQVVDQKHHAEFECTDCRQEFLLYSKNDSTGLYVTELKKQKTLHHCPKCTFLKPLGVDECPHCGVFESKYVEIQKIENPRLYELNKAWNTVITDLTSDAFHQKFLDLAQKQSALNYAAQKYSDLKKVMGDDPLLEKYLKQVEIRLEAQIQTKLMQSRVEQSSEDLKYEQSQRLFIIVAVLGTVVFLINKVNPLFPNLNGLIVAVTLLSYGLWFLAKSSRKNTPTKL